MKFSLVNIGTIQSLGSRDFLLMTPNASTVVLLERLPPVSNTNSKLELFETSTISSNGTLIGSHNTDRDSLVSPGLLTFVDPIVTSDGSLIYSNTSPLTNDNSSMISEFVLTANTSYIIRISNMNNSLMMYTLKLSWRELSRNEYEEISSNPQSEIIDVVDRRSRLLGVVQISGQYVNTNISGQAIITSMSGNIVQVSGQEVKTSISGNIVQISGQIVQISGQSLFSIGQLTPIEKVVIHNQVLPSANTNWLGSDIIPTNTPCLFRIMVSVSQPGKLSAAVTRGSNTQVSTFNNNSSMTGGTINIFDILVHSGDTINFRYSASTGTIQFLRVQEIDSSTQ